MGLISSVHKLSSRENLEKISRQSRDLNLGLLGEKRERYLYTPPPANPPPLESLVT